MIDPSLGEDTLVLLMRGKNTFGDKIYSYVKLTLQDLQRMQAAIKQGQPFNPSDFGTVVAAGQGEPTAEVKQEINSLYKVLDPSRGTSPEASAPLPKQKSWDEY